MDNRNRPPPQYPGPMAEAVILPELRGITIEDMTRGALALRLWCRNCGRDVLITPTGLRQLGRRVQPWTAERFVRAARCDTCGQQQAQGSGWPLEPAHAGRAIIIRQERHGGPRLDRK
ncbi:MAG: hypothetical protein Q8S03_10100 [Brevundimonas sp.]|uniref:hypothetical protein n=1 Tax=Brevundimonas sp. TaxID=1871086 RepID=UPI002736B7D1|nr:hypothetical protein [Brevundimonas sp.]MDP3405030.1 hypothetical protein [Brevundimonas sp.]